MGGGATLAPVFPESKSTIVTRSNIVTSANRCARSRECDRTSPFGIRRATCFANNIVETMLPDSGEPGGERGGGRGGGCNLIGEITFGRQRVVARARARSSPTNLQCKPRPEERRRDTCTISKGLFIRYSGSFRRTLGHVGIYTCMRNTHAGPGHLSASSREIDAATLLFVP